MMYIFLQEANSQCEEKCLNFIMCWMCSLHSLYCFLIIRRRQSQGKNRRDGTPLQLDGIPPGSVDSTGSAANPVYENMGDIQQHNQGNLRCYVSIHSTKASFLAL